MVKIQRPQLAERMRSDIALIRRHLTQPDVIFVTPKVLVQGLAAGRCIGDVDISNGDLTVNVCQSLWRRERSR